MNNTIINYNESTEFANLALDKSYIIAIDSHLVSTHHIEVPKMSFSKAKKAIPFLLEDVLLDDIEALDFFLQKAAGEQYYEVIVISKNIMNVLRKKLETTGLKIERCVVDFMLLPIEKGKVYCTKVKPDVLFRYGDFLGGKTNQAVLDELFTDNDQILSEKLNVKYAQKINLLNVDWSSNWKEKLYKWRASIIILLLLMVLSPVQLILDNHNLTQRVNGQSNINEIYFKKLFPEVSRIVDLHAQIKQKLSTLSIKEQSDDDLLAKIQSDIKTKTKIKQLQFNKQVLKVEP
jgi:general secretion pathway protein L